MNLEETRVFEVVMGYHLEFARERAVVTEMAVGVRGKKEMEQGEEWAMEAKDVVEMEEMGA